MNDYNYIRRTCWYHLQTGTHLRNFVKSFEHLDELWLNKSHWYVSLSFYWTCKLVFQWICTGTARSFGHLSAFFTSIIVFLYNTLTCDLVRLLCFENKHQWRLINLTRPYLNIHSRLKVFPRLDNVRYKGKSPIEKAETNFEMKFKGIFRDVKAKYFSLYPLLNWR